MTALLARSLQDAKKVAAQPVLLRLDGGNDAIENIEAVLAHNAAHKDLPAVDFLIKWNPRRQNKTD